MDSSLCVPLAASWREVPVLIRLHIEASDVPKWVKCKCLNQAQIVHAYDSAGPVISSAMMMIDFTSGGVSTKYRPDRACRPHFSHGAAYEGF